MALDFPEGNAYRRRLDAERRARAAQVAAQYTGSQASTRRGAPPTGRQAAAQQREEIRGIIRRWNPDAPVPDELKGSTAQPRAARAAWLEMQDAGRIAARLPMNTPEQLRAVDRTRVAQDRLLDVLGLTREEVVARYGNTADGLAAIALLQY